MKKEEVMRKYNFSDAYLMQLGDNMLSLLDRDIVEFTDRGFNPQKRVELKNRVDDFKNYETDEQLEGIKITATEEKDAKRTIVERMMRTTLLMARTVFKEGSGRYREFGDSDISRQSDEVLVRNAKIVCLSATKYLAELSDEGLTAAKIADLDAARISFDESIDVQRQAINARDISTEGRVETGNSLYELIVKYCEIGKDIWVETNQAKYNDYVIYNTPASPAKNTNAKAENNSATENKEEPKDTDTPSNDI